MTINGKVIITDFSFWQDNDETPYKVDLRAMRAGGIDGSIIRAGQNTWMDEDFRDYYTNALLIDYPIGAYWFYDSRSTPESQAALFYEALKDFPFPKLGIWADYEERYNGAWGGAVHFRIFVEELQRRFPGKLVGIYTAPSYWSTNTTFLQRDWFGRFPLWIAHYGVTSPTVPTPWTNYLIWQYSETGDGVKYGVESRELDMNLFNGSFEQYKLVFGLGDIQPIEPTQEGEFGMFEVSSDTYRMSLRRTNEVSGAFIEYIPTRTIMKADRIVPQISGGMPGDKWAHIIEAGGVTKDGWVAVVHNGVVYCNFRDITPPSTTGLPTITVTLEAEGYPTKVVEWLPNP